MPWVAAPWAPMVRPLKSICASVLLPSIENTCTNGLPLYANLVKMDLRYLEAAADLGATPLQAFWRITVPLSKSGIIAGAMLNLYPTLDEANAELKNGRVDAVIADKFPLLEWINKASDDCCSVASQQELHTVSGCIAPAAANPIVTLM